MGFKIGQRVKVMGSEVELGEYFAQRCAGMVGNLTEIKRNDPDSVTHRVEFDDNYLGVWVKPEHLELIPDDGKQSDATPPQVYPPLRNVDDNNKPLYTWQQVLKNYPLAASQPHLFLLGYYRSDIYDLEQFAKDAPRSILMSTIACSNAAIGGSETQPCHIVFVITEDE